MHPLCLRQQSNVYVVLIGPDLHLPGDSRIDVKRVAAILASVCRDRAPLWPGTKLHSQSCVFNRTTLAVLRTSLGVRGVRSECDQFGFSNIGGIHLSAHIQSQIHKYWVANQDHFQFNHEKIESLWRCLVLFEFRTKAFNSNIVYGWNEMQTERVPTDYEFLPLVCGLESSPLNTRSVRFE